MNDIGFDEGDVLWIDRAVHGVAELPDGLAFLVQVFLGRADQGRAVWVRGMVIDGDARGQLLTMCVSTDQPRAVPRKRVPDHTPRHAVNAADANRRPAEDSRLVGPPPGYRRREIG